MSAKMGEAFYRGRLVTPGEFVRYAGANWKDAGIYASCKACGEPAYPCLAHDTNPGITPYFRHLQDGEECPLFQKKSSSQSEEMPQDWDSHAGNRLRTEFCERENLKQGYAVCHKLCHGRLTSDEFVAFCREADRRHIWAYKGLPLIHVPYVLVTLKELDAELADRARHARKHPLRLVLGRPKGTSVDALWERPRDCRILSVFPSGEVYRAYPPVVIGEPSIESARSCTGWINNGLAERIRECCLKGAAKRAKTQV